MYIDIDEKEIVDSYISAIEGKRFVWIFKSMSVNIGLYPLINNEYLIRTSTNKGLIEIVNNLSVLNAIIKRETLGAQWLDDEQWNRILLMLEDIEKIDLSHLMLAS